MSKKVTGIGGVFFNCDDPNKMKEWYGRHLGLETNEYGSTFKSRDLDDPEKVNILQWSTFAKDTKYIEPSKASFMINYRVENLVELERPAAEVALVPCLVPIRPALAWL